MSNPVLRTWAAALGGDVAGGQVLCPGPGHSPRDRSLAVTPSQHDADGFIVHSHAGDDWRACRDHVRERLRLPAVDRHPRQATPRHSDNASRARALWDEAQSPHGTLAEKYLATRSLRLPEDIGGSVVRFHPRCPWGDARVPAMLTPFRLIANARIITAIQHTALSPDGAKIDRWMLGKVNNAAIMIDPDQRVTQGLVIAEGFETALSGRQLGWRPVWALGSAGAIAGFPVLGGIECLTVLAELDDTNALAIKVVGKRWNAAGREVLIISPRYGGDANDALRSVA